MNCTQVRSGALRVLFIVALLLSGIGLVAAACIPASSAYAATDTALVDAEHHLKYENTADGRGVKILGPEGIVTWLQIPAAINGKPVLEIGAGAFKGDTAVRDIAFLDGSQVATIGASAFEGCTSLVQCSLPASVTAIGDSAFSGCTLMTSFKFSTNAKVTSIGQNAFFDCSALPSLDIPVTVSSIGVDAFRNVDTVTLPNGTPIKTIEANVFGGVKHVVLGEGVEAISGNAFTSKKNSLRLLESISLPSTLTTIGNSAFYGSTKLEEISIPAAVASIGDSAFWNCSKLASISFPIDSKLASIGESAFYNCKSLGSFAIPVGVSSLGDKVFRSCTKLTSIRIPKNVPALGEYAFSGCTSLESVAFTEGSVLASIGNFAFEKCSALTRMDVPAGVATIGYSAFNSCTSLESLQFAEDSKLTRIEEDSTRKDRGAFQKCTALGGVELPASLTYIGRYAFADCTMLENITLSCDSARFGEHCFYGLCSSDRSYVHVPNERMFSQLAENDNFVNRETTDVIIKSGKIHLISKADVQVLSITYDAEGNSHLEVRVTYDGKELIPGVDYTAELEVSTVDKKTRVLVRGTGHVGNDGDADEDEKEQYVGFVRKNFEGIAIKVDVPAGVEGLVYDGLEHKGIPESASYKVSSGSSSATNAGTYEAVVSLTDQANCEWADGTKTDKTVSWSIAPAPASVVPADASKIFGASDPKFKATVTGLVGKDKASKISYTLSRAEGEDEGEYTISAAGDELQGNYRVQYGTATFTIQRKDLSKASLVLAQSRYTYTGRAIRPSVTVKLAGKTLQQGSDYTLQYGDNTGVGTGYVNVNGMGNYEGTASRTFTIVASSGSAGSSSTSGTAWSSIPTTITTGTAVTINGAKYKVKSGSEIVYQKAPKSATSATVPTKVIIRNKTYKVAGIAANAFKGTKVKTLTVKTKLLTKANAKKCLTGSKVKTVKVPKAKKKAYKKIFTKKVAGKKVTVK